MNVRLASRLVAMAPLVACFAFAALPVLCSYLAEA